MAMPTRRDILIRGSAALAATLAGSSCTLSVAPATRSARPARRLAWLAALVFFAGLAVLAAIVISLVVMS